MLNTRKPKAMTENASAFLRQVKDYQRRFGLSDGQMAIEKLKVGQSTYSKWFGKAETSPQPDAVIRFARLVGKRFDEMLADAGYWPADVELPRSEGATRTLRPEHELLIEAWERGTPTDHRYLLATARVATSTDEPRNAELEEERASPRRRAASGE